MNELQQALQMLAQQASNHFLYDPQSKRVAPQSPYWGISEANEQTDPKMREKALNDMAMRLVMQGTMSGVNAKKVSQVPIKKLISHEGAPDIARVRHYKELLKAGKKIDPLLTIREGSKHGVEDGKHRLQALIELGRTHAPARMKDPWK